ncbi:MAG: late secretory pathway protein avl9 [Piccolia ochrophora]|nr:MAG: late secretory pathway protein avl9 [Piccolia ochrophora]
MADDGGFPPLVTVVGFHHARGPEVETWFGVEDGSDPAVDNEWPHLPFMALSDGAHASTEDFSYFTLRREGTATRSASSLFGISCTRQMDASELINRPADVTRSTVQKAVVVVADSPQAFGQIREKLSVVTNAWFAQRNFTDVDIIKKFQESLSKTLQDGEDERDQYLVLSYMGMPLQLFGKGSLFGPYTPLQQLDVLADHDTRSYIVGSTNSLLLQQKDRYSDILINLDEGTIAITSPSLRAALSLTVADRRWIDFLTQSVQDTWDDANPTRPKTMGYVGSEEFIRLQFEEYLLSLISSVKYHIHLKTSNDSKSLLSDVVEGDPSLDYGAEWVDAWMKTENFSIFQKFTDSHLFDIVEPRHPCAGGLTVEDIQRRLSQQVSELHLDERFNSGREAISKHLATGQKKVSSAFNNLWTDIEVMREAQRKRHDERQATASTGSSPSSPKSSSEKNVKYPRAADFSTASANISAASSKASTYLSSTRAGSYLSSWKSGWGSRSPSTQSSPPKSSAATTTPRHAKRRSKGGGHIVDGAERDSTGLVPLEAGKVASHDGSSPGVVGLKPLELGRKDHSSPAAAPGADSTKPAPDAGEASKEGDKKEKGKEGWEEVELPGGDAEHAKGGSSTFDTDTPKTQ